MNGGAVVNLPADVVNPAVSRQLATDINSYRIGIVAEKLAMSAQKEDPQKFFHLCLSLARGIDYGVANNEPPAQASKLAPVLKQVSARKSDFFLQSAIMVLMISVKNACKLGWFSAKDTEELLTLADEVANFFCSRKDINTDAGSIMPALSSVMSRYYPQYKLGHIIASLEVKPGYGTYLADFHITKDILISKDERIRLLVAMRNKFETSSCIVNPQLGNIMLNGRPVDRRTNVLMDPGPQAPTVVNQLLKYGTNLLQAVGQFNDHYILVIAAMKTLQTSDLPAPEDYVPADTGHQVYRSDSEIIEGASRISLNCPISYKRINIPTKGSLCKHYQCFDLSNYVEINLKRPSWRCPHCNQPVCFTDLRVDRTMVKVLREVGENVSEVTISADGSWTAASNINRKDESLDKTTNRQEGNDAEEPSVKSDGPCNLYDLTGEDDEMDTEHVWELVDKKPVVQDLQCQNALSNSTFASIPISTNGLNQYFTSQGTTGQYSATLSDPGTATFNLRSEPSTDGNARALPGNFGIAPVLTDAVSPSLNRQPSNYQGTNYRPNSNNFHLQEAAYGRQIPRNITRTPSAIQALPVQMPSASPQQHFRPIMSLPAGSGSATPFQIPLASNQLGTSSVASNVERQRHLPQLQLDHHHMSSMAPASQQNRAVSQGVGVTNPSYNSWMPQTLSQPPHLMRSSHLPRSHPQQGNATGVGFGNSPSSVQRVQLAPQQSLQMRHHQVPQTQSIRIPTSLPSTVVTPQAVSRPENLIDIQQAEQNWRPAGRMRGALTGQAYSAALSQYMSSNPSSTQTHSPSPRPPASAVPSMANLQILIANRMIAHATQPHNQQSSSSIAPETAVSQAGGPQGLI